jgi:hypothetical protein
MLQHLFTCSFVALTFVAVSLQAGSLNTCTAPGFSVSVVDTACTFPDQHYPPGSFAPGDPRNTIPPSPGKVTAYSGVNISGNELTMGGLAFLVSAPYNTDGPFPQVFHAVWNDTYPLPATDPNDVYKITEIIGGLSNTGILSVGPLVDTTICDIHYFGNPVCTVTGTLLAFQAMTAVDSGQFNLSFDEASEIYGLPGPNGTNFGTRLTLDRFRPDGVTPDPFTQTPEPPSSLLLLAGLAFAALFAQRVRSKSSLKEFAQRVRSKTLSGGCALVQVHIGISGQECLG